MRIIFAMHQILNASTFHWFCSSFRPSTMKAFGGLLLFQLAAQLLLGQSPVLKHFTVQEGLPSNTVYHITEDQNGLLWCATDMGLARWDGQSFEVLTAEQGMPDNELFSVFIDREQRKWFSSYNGRLGYMRADGQLLSIEVAKPTILPHEMIRSFTQTDHGDIFFTKAGALFKVLGQKYTPVWQSISVDVCWSFGDTVYLANGPVVERYPQGDTLSPLPFGSRFPTRVYPLSNRQVALTEGLTALLMGHEGIQLRIDLPKKYGELIAATSVCDSNSGRVGKGC